MVKKLIKYFIGYGDNYNIRTLCVKLPKMIGYAKYFDDNKAISFNVSGKNFRKKQTKICERLSILMKINFDREPVYGDRINKNKKSHMVINTNFQCNKIPTENALQKCLSLIMLDSVIGVNKKYYPQKLLEECKYIIKNNKMENLINNGLDRS